jgi:hypothetical protein
MRLEKKDQVEIAERKGLTIRTIIQIIWLLISFGIAYFVLEVLEENGYISYPQLRRALSLPPELPNWATQDWVLQGAIMLIFVVIMQFVLFLAFVWFSPEGRRRPGDATVQSRHKDPFDSGMH